MVLAAFAAVAAVAVHGWLFPLYSLNRDDSVYVAMARVLETGHLTLPAADHEAFRPWASAVVGDRIVLKYTPPWPAVLALGDLLTGTMTAALGLTAAAAAVLAALLAREVLRDRTAAIVAGALLALSPAFLLQSGTYLPYVFQLALGLAFAVLLLTGARRRSTGLVVAAGVVVGIAAWARPYDTVLFGAPFVVAVAAMAWRGRRDPDAWPWWGWLTRLLAGVVPVGLLVLGTNAIVLGDPLRLPYTVTGPQDGFGFGERGVFPTSTVPFTPSDGVDGLLENLRWLPSWSAGGIVLVVLALVGLLAQLGPVRRALDPPRALLPAPAKEHAWQVGGMWAVVAVAVVVPLGYLPFWGPYSMSVLWNGIELFGPYYLLPVLVPLVVLAAVPLVTMARAARRSGAATADSTAGERAGRARPRRWRPAVAVLTAVVVAGMAALTAAAVPDKVAGNLAVQDDFRALQRLVDDSDLGRSVLLLPYRGNLGFLSASPFLENDPSLDQPVLYAETRGPLDFALLDRYPDRTLWRLSQEVPPERTTGGSLVLDQLRLQTGSTITVRLSVTNPTDRPLAVAYLFDGVAGSTRRVLDEASSTGREYDVTWTLAAPGAPGPDAPDTVHLPADPGSGVLAVGLDLPDPAAPETPGQRWEQRIAWRTVDGGTQLQLLQPGQGWSIGAGPDAAWQVDVTDNPVVELAGAPTG